MKAIFLPFLLLIGGCAAAPLAALGTAVGMAGTAVTTGADVYSLGKLDGAEARTADDVRVGVFLAADEMGMETEFEKPTGTDRVIRFRDERGSETDVTIESRTPTLTWVRVNVGKTGSEPTARLFLRLMREHFPAVHSLEGVTP